MNNKLLSHFCVYSLTPSFWELPSEEKNELLQEWFENMTGKNSPAETVWFYQVFPTREEGDFMIWSTVKADEKPALHEFNRKYAEAVNPYRLYAEPTQVLWGMTKPSMYAKRKTVSDQEMDPFAKTRQPYLVVYPFTKTAEWYLKGREARQGMMNEHIKIGKEFPEIKQQLLYSFGLQDDEFVVVYEMEDAAQFSDLVYDLRSTEARLFTANDLPIITGTHLNPADLRKVLASD
jgi:chlorite dismutase